MLKSLMVMAALTTMLTTTQTKETGMEGLTHSWCTFPPGYVALLFYKAD